MRRKIRPYVCVCVYTFTREWHTQSECSSSTSDPSTSSRIFNIPRNETRSHVGTPFKHRCFPVSKDALEVPTMIPAR